MGNEKENIISYESNGRNSEEHDTLDELEAKFQSALDESLEDLRFLEKEKEKIGSPENLGKVIEDVVWEQVKTQVAVTAGQDFMKGNKGFKLDLSDDAHIQNSENFTLENPKLASHNMEIDYEERHKEWTVNFLKDKNGKILLHKTRTGEEEATLRPGARAPYDKDRSSGTDGMDMDHIVPAGEFIRDPVVNAHLTQEERVAFLNNPDNLNLMDASWNRSKGDKSTEVWLNTPNKRGQTPSEIFKITPEQEKELLAKDKFSREKLAKSKEEAERKAVASGKKSQQDEAFRISGAALRTAIMSLLASLLKEIIKKMVEWFRDKEKSFGTFLTHLKEAILEFVSNIKKHIISAGQGMLETIATAIIGPVVRTVKKVWLFLKQGWSSLKDAIEYIKKPENKGKSMNILLMEVGKIIIAGLATAGALGLSEVIEKLLMAVPIFAVEIPLLGSMASIFGIFMGAVVSGVIGAIAMNSIDKIIAKHKEKENRDNTIKKSNEVLSLQCKIENVAIKKIDITKTRALEEIAERHKCAHEEMRDSLKNIKNNLGGGESIDEKLDRNEDLLNSI